MFTVKLRIHGTVQGVGYRYALRREAERLGVNGWVRNRLDGSVEALLQGEPQAVEALIGWARTGPPAARVTQVTTERTQAPAPPPGAGFELLPTA